MAKSAFAFDCFKKGHKPMDGVPSDVFVLNGYAHTGAVCKNCKGVYYVQISDRKMDEMPMLVNTDGQRILSD